MQIPATLKCDGISIPSHTEIKIDVYVLSLDAKLEIQEDDYRRQEFSGLRNVIKVIRLPRSTTLVVRWYYAFPLGIVLRN